MAFLYLGWRNGKPAPARAAAGRFCGQYGKTAQKNPHAAGAGVGMGVGWYAAGAARAAAVSPRDVNYFTMTVVGGYPHSNAVAAELAASGYLGFGASASCSSVDDGVGAHGAPWHAPCALRHARHSIQHARRTRSSPRPLRLHKGHF